MSNRITLDELKSYLWNSAVLLRTNIDAGAYKQYIFPLLFFKRICDVYDEETRLAIAEYGDSYTDFSDDEIHTFVVPEGHHWSDVRQVPRMLVLRLLMLFMLSKKLTSTSSTVFLATVRGLIKIVCPMHCLRT